MKNYILPLATLLLATAAVNAQPTNNNQSQTLPQALDQATQKMRALQEALPANGLEQAEKRIGQVQSGIAEGFDQAKFDELKGRIDDLEEQVKSLQQSLQTLESKTTTAQQG